MADLYPIFLDLIGKPCLVVGGGSVAQRKVTGLLEAGAAVTVIAPEITSSLSSLAKSGEIRVLARPFKSGDEKDQWLVFCATDQEEVNRSVHAACEAAGVPVNVADRPGLCRFQVPGRFKEGKLQVAVSTQGGSPALSRKLRKDFSESLHPWAARLVDWLGELRPRLKARIPDDVKKRGDFLNSLVDGHFDTLKAWANNDDKQAFEALITRMLDEAERDE